MQTECLWFKGIFGTQINDLLVRWIWRPVKNSLKGRTANLRVTCDRLVAELIKKGVTPGGPRTMSGVLK